MKEAIKQLLDLVNGMSFDEAYTAVDQFYQRVASAASYEWQNSMTNDERRNLITALLAYKTK